MLQLFWNRSSVKLWHQVNVFAIIRVISIIIFIQTIQKVLKVRYIFIDCLSAVVAEVDTVAEYPPHPNFHALKGTKPSLPFPCLVVVAGSSYRSKPRFLSCFWHRLCLFLLQGLLHRGVSEDVAISFSLSCLCSFLGPALGKSWSNSTWFSSRKQTFESGDWCT